MMDGSGWVRAPVRRDQGGRFVPGVSGNPAGKRKGTRNRATLLAMLLSVDESGEITRAVIERAKAGDMVAARFCLKQILPKRRSREIPLDLPECRDIADVVAAFDVTVAAMAAGEITPDEALSVSKVLERRRHALEAKALQAERGDDAAAVAASAAEAPAQATASDLHPACNNSANKDAAVAASAEETPAQTVASDLHPACNNSVNEAAAVPAKPEPRPQRQPLPTFGSACIPPALRGPGRRFAGPMPPGPPAVDCPPSPGFA
jgi:hypothetical protein